jgi:glycosyltransferase domain-containing protein|tara:strand:- start:898 stop:1971 length:1074 start_codon:yes stop_codon:yes gene_type:complete
MEKLTIIIPSNNRPYHLRRSVIYWNNYNLPVIIVDGSNNTQKKWMDNNANQNIEYFHKKIPLPERLSTAGKLIKTEYSIFLCDDEFYSFDALKKCVNFLELNNDYVAVNGQAIGFKFSNKELVFNSKSYSEWEGRKREEEDPKKRITLHMRNYANPLGVSVIRSNLFRKCADLYFNHEFPIFAQWEYQMNLILSFAGKSITLDTLMHFRSFEEDTPSIPSITKNHIPSLNLKNKIDKFWLEPQNEKLKIDFINVLSKFLKSIKPEYQLDYCKDALITAVDGYIHERRSKAKLFFLRTIIYIKQFIKFTLKALFKVRVHQFKNLANIENLLRAKGVSVNHDDIDKIISALNYLRYKIK